MTDQKPAKALRTRCPNCRQSLFNDPIDVDAHRTLCPQLLAREISNLKKANERLLERIEGLEENEPAEPAVDLDEVAAWEDVDEADGLDLVADATADSGHILPAIDREDGYFNGGTIR